jgi:hypothetical protein
VERREVRKQIMRGGKERKENERKEKGRGSTGCFINCFQVTSHITKPTVHDG